MFFLKARTFTVKYFTFIYDYNKKMIFLLYSMELQILDCKSTSLF